MTSFDGHVEVVDVKEARPGRYRLYSRSADDFFRNEHGDPRQWKTPSGPQRFLRAVCKRLPSAMYKLMRLDGKILHIGRAVLDANQFGSHEWRKTNSFTMHDQSGLYDVWKCNLCGEEQKRYGLSGRPSQGVCSKNAIEGVGEDATESAD